MQRLQDAAMSRAKPRYAKTADGKHIAYLVMGDGPVDLVCAFGYMSNIDADGGVSFHAASDSAWRASPV
jgi:hypothetical protein